VRYTLDCEELLNAGTVEDDRITVNKTTIWSSAHSLARKSEHVG